MKLLCIIKKIALTTRSGETSGLAVRQAADTRPAALVTDEPLARTKGEEENPVLCRSCGGVVTTPAMAMEVNGSHEHTFFNPVGIIYEVRCFRRAVGCTPYGASSNDFTWFSGHTWQMSLCANCLTHLGWQFQGAADCFHALIHNRLM